MTELDELESVVGRGDLDGVAAVVGRLRAQGTPARSLLQAGLAGALDGLPSDGCGALALVALSSAFSLAEDSVDPGRSLLLGQGLGGLAAAVKRGGFRATPEAGVDSRPETLDEAMAHRRPLAAAGAVVAAATERGPAAARWMLYRAATRVFTRGGDALIGAVWVGRLLDRLAWGDAAPSVLALLMTGFDRLQNPERVDAAYWHPTWPSLPAGALVVRRGRRPVPRALDDVLAAPDIFELDTTLDASLRSGMDVDALAEAVIVAAARRLLRTRRRDTATPEPPVLWLGEPARALVLAHAARSAWRDAPSTETLLGVWQAARYHVQTAWVEHAQWDPAFWPTEPPPGATGEVLLSTACKAMREGQPGLATACAQAFQSKWMGHSVVRDAARAHLSRGVGGPQGLMWRSRSLELAAAAVDEMRRSAAHRDLLATALVRTLASPDLAPDTAFSDRMAAALNGR
ncbi:MAG: hypothetical protein AMXMBFR64_11790 [Myxococcales bacterium]